MATKRGAFLTQRRRVQLGFLVLILVGVFVVRGNAERWCPFGGVEAIYAYVTEGNVLCSIGVSNFFVLGGVLLTLLLVRRAFCGYACPVGTVSEWVGEGAKRLGIRPRRVPLVVDRVLSLLKYVVLALILFVTWRASELLFRTACPAYALLGRHGEDITFWAYVVSGAILLFSVFLVLPFCRWFCPFAAVMNVFSRFGLGRVARDPEACVDCGKCQRSCPMAIPVDKVEQVKEARCIACLQCVDACPTQGRKTLAWRLPFARSWAIPKSVVMGTFLVVMAAAVAGAALVPLPSFTYTRGDAPAVTETVELNIYDLTCRGRANLLVYYLERDDDLMLPGYLRFEGWPTPGVGRARITFDPAETTAEAVKQAVAESYYDYDLGLWRHSPFVIEGFDPLAIPVLLEDE